MEEPVLTYSVSNLEMPRIWVLVRSIWNWNNNKERYSSSRLETLLCLEPKKYGTSICSLCILGLDLGLGYFFMVS